MYKRKFYANNLVNCFPYTVINFVLWRTASQMTTGHTLTPTSRTFYESVYMELRRAPCSGAKCHINRILSCLVSSICVVFVRAMCACKLYEDNKQEIGTFINNKFFRQFVI